MISFTHVTHESHGRSFLHGSCGETSMLLVINTPHPRERLLALLNIQLDFDQETGRVTSQPWPEMKRPHDNLVGFVNSERTSIALSGSWESAIQNSRENSRDVA